MDDTKDVISDRNRETLLSVLDTMIPADGEYGVPSASDPAIVEDILRTGGEKLATFDEAYAALEEAAQTNGGAFASLSPDTRLAIIEASRAGHGRFLHAVTAIAIQCYYRDDRVMEALGMEPRPPFPDGYVLPQGDWSLLDPVRARPKLYRRV